MTPGKVVPMTTVLDEILVGVRADLAAREAALPFARLAQLVDRAPAPRNPLPALGSGRLSVISEVKRSSPSKGALADISDAAQLGLSYQSGGAAAISVLTERHRFGGSLDDLRAVRAAVDVPVLRKDFVVSEYQLVETRAYGADLALLIVACLDDALLNRLYGTALDLGLTPLVEVHTVEELDRALALGPALLGINNRNLKNLQVDLAMFEELAPLVPAGVIKISESGVLGPDDARRVRLAGADAVLVGEALVKDGDPAAAIKTLVAAAGDKPTRSVTAHDRLPAGDSAQAQ